MALEGPKAMILHTQSYDPLHEEAIVITPIDNKEPEE